MTSVLRSGVLVLAIIAVGLGAWLGRERPASPRTPIDVGADAHLDIRYGADERNVLDVYVPTEAGPHPVIVYFHPGGWVEGDKAMSIPIWDWTERGYAVVSVNYTFARSPKTIRDAVEDADEAVRFVLTHADEWDLDRERVGLFGFSAGGHLVAMLSQQDLPIAAVAVAGAPIDLVGLLDPTTRYFDGATGAAVPALIERRLGCVEGVVDDGRSCETEAHELSPNEASAPLAPMLILHGALDAIVDPSHARSYHAALDAQGADVRLEIVDDGGHWPESASLDEFFDQILEPPGG